MTIAAIQGEALIMGRPKGQLLSSFCMAQKLCGYLFQWLEKKEEKYCFMTHEKHMRFKFQFL